MGFARSVAAVTAALLLAGCAADATSSGVHHGPLAQNRTGPAQTATGETTAGGAAVERHRHRPLRYTFPVHGCSSSPSTSHHDYPASDIFTQPGCKFVAVVRGRVD